jgi:hypothetical protein
MEEQVQEQVEPAKINVVKEKLELVKTKAGEAQSALKAQYDKLLVEFKALEDRANDLEQKVIESEAVAKGKTAWQKGISWFDGPEIPVVQLGLIALKLSGHLTLSWSATFTPLFLMILLKIVRTLSK